MSDASLARARISAIINEIAATQRALGIDVRETADREAFDTVSRIERRALAAASPKEKGAA